MFKRYHRAHFGTLGPEALSSIRSPLGMVKVQAFPILLILLSTARPSGCDFRSYWLRTVPPLQPMP